MSDLTERMLAGAWEVVSAGAVWICVWGCIGRLAGHTRGRPIAGAWLGILLGPIGAAIAFCLADLRGTVATAPRTSSAQLRARMARPRAGMTVACSHCGTEMRDIPGAGVYTCGSCGGYIEVKPMSSPALRSMPKPPTEMEAFERRFAAANRSGR